MIDLPKFNCLHTATAWSFSYRIITYRYTTQHQRHKVTFPHINRNSPLPPSHKLSTQSQNISQLSTKVKSPLMQRRLRCSNQGGGVESKSTMFKAFIAEAAVEGCGQKVTGACCGSNPRTSWWKLVVKEAGLRKRPSTLG